MSDADPLDLNDVADVIKRAASSVPEGARVYVEFNSLDTVTISTTHHGVATQTADALNLPKQHPPREHVQQWARGVNANGKHAVLAVECIDTNRMQRIWGQERVA